MRLAPLTADHVDALWDAAQDPRTWEFNSAVIRSADQARTYVETALAWQRAGTAVPFATVDRATNRVIGSTRFANIDRDHRRAEIGWTWINPKWWRTAINTEAKFLMLRHAFEEWQCIRVEFKASAKNQRSREAIARIGGIEEGTLRRHGSASGIEPLGQLAPLGLDPDVQQVRVQSRVERRGVGVGPMLEFPRSHQR